MEHLNKVELRGKIGSVKTKTFGEGTCAHFSIATNCTYQGNGGMPVIETTWHSVIAWDGKSIATETLTSLKQGDCVYVKGRLRMRRYIDAGGQERTFYEVVASLVEIVE